MILLKVILLLQVFKFKNMFRITKITVSDYDEILNGDLNQYLPGKIRVKLQKCFKKPN